jgi:hypothetical protein
LYMPFWFPRLGPGSLSRPAGAAHDLDQPTNRRGAPGVALRRGRRAERIIPTARSF